MVVDVLEELRSELQMVWFKTFISFYVALFTYYITFSHTFIAQIPEGNNKRDCNYVEFCSSTSFTQWSLVICWSVGRSCTILAPITNQSLTTCVIFLKTRIALLSYMYIKAQLKGTTCLMVISGWWCLQRITMELRKELLMEF